MWQVYNSQLTAHLTPPTLGNRATLMIFILTEGLCIVANVMHKHFICILRYIFPKPRS